MKTIDIQSINTKRNPIMVYDDLLDNRELSKPCQQKIDRANQMLKTYNFFDKIKKEEKITRP